MNCKIALTLALTGAFFLNGCLSAQEKQQREQGAAIAEAVIEAVSELLAELERAGLGDGAEKELAKARALLQKHRGEIAGKLKHFELKLGRDGKELKKALARMREEMPDVAQIQAEVAKAMAKMRHSMPDVAEIQAQIDAARGQLSHAMKSMPAEIRIEIQHDLHEALEDAREEIHEAMEEVHLELSKPAIKLRLKEALGENFSAELEETIRDSLQGLGKSLHGVTALSHLEGQHSRKLEGKSDLQDKKKSKQGSKTKKQCDCEDCHPSAKAEAKNQRKVSTRSSATRARAENAERRGRAAAKRVKAAAKRVKAVAKRAQARAERTQAVAETRSKAVAKRSQARAKEMAARSRARADKQNVEVRIRGAQSRRSPPRGRVSKAPRTGVRQHAPEARGRSRAARAARPRVVRSRAPGASGGSGAHTHHDLMEMIEGLRREMAELHEMVQDMRQKASRSRRIN